MKLDGNNNKNKLYIIIIVGLLFLFVVGISFAYFQTQYGNGRKVDLKAKTYSVDELSFNIGEDITLNPNQFNFAQGKGNLEGATNAAAILKANNKTNLAKMNYYAYVVVTKNEFKYTTSDKKAELVLSVEGPNGVVTTLPDLGNAIDVTDNAGTTFKAFDITEFSGVITLADNKEIEVTSGDNGKKQEDWKIKVTFINLDADQSNNSDKNFNANMIIQSTGYKYTMADICESGLSISNCVTAMSDVDGDIYHHDGTITDSSGNVIDASDGSYRYSGANPNNYVCFGSSEETCPADNLYRIIGVIDGKTKLISAYGATTDMLGTDGDYSQIYDEDTSSYKGLNDVSKIGVYYWNSTGKNTWSTSAFSSINLNINYLSYLKKNSSDWNYMIDRTTWYVGGLSVNNAMYSNAKNVYNYEVGASKDTSTTVTSKIGLMYLSEYYYGAIPKYWTLPGYNSSGNDYSKAYNDNWMNQGLYEWTISRNSSGTPYSFHVYLDGEVAQSSVSVSHAVRPTFNLTEAVIYFSGSGTISDPVRLDYMH